MEKQYKYKLAITMNTKNRQSFVKELLEKLTEPLYERNIGLYLFDGSDEDSLTGIVEQYMVKGYDNIHYSYYDPKVYVIYKDGKAGDWQRVYDSKMSVDAKYVWLCSDKMVPRKECLDKVLEQLDKNYSVIVYNTFPFYRRDEVTREYFDKVEFFRDCAPKLQMLLIPILHRGIIEQYTMDNLEKCFFGNKYTDIEIIFQSIAGMKDFSALLLCTGDRSYKRYRMNLPFEVKTDKRSGHVKEKRTLETFIGKVYDTISGLPSIYDNEKETVMKNFSCYTWFSLEGFALLRAQDGYYFKQCLQYLDKFKLVTDVPVPVILGISLLPRFMAKCLQEVIYAYKKLRKIK